MYEGVGLRGGRAGIMTICILYTIPNILRLISNKNKLYFGGKTDDHNM